MSTVSKDRHKTVNVPVPNPAGNPAYDLALVKDHIAQPIDKQQKLTAQDWRAVAHVLVNRAKKFSLSFNKSDAANMHHVIQSAGIAYDKAYKGADGDQRGPAHVLIQLFGASDVGVKMARNLQRMIPTARVVDGTATPADHQGDTTLLPPPTTQTN